MIVRRALLMIWVAILSAALVGLAIARPTKAVAAAVPMLTNPRTGDIIIADPQSGLIRLLAPSGKLDGAAVDLGGIPIAMALDPTGTTLFVATRDSATAQTGTISAIDLGTRQITNAIALNTIPAGITYDAVHHTILVADSTGAILQNLQWPTGQPARPILVPGASLSADAPAGINPVVGTINTELLMWAGGFTPGEKVSVDWGVVPIATTTASATGAAYAHFLVPAHLLPGQYPVLLYGTVSGISKSAVFTVILMPKPKPTTVSPLSSAVKVAQKLLTTGALASVGKAVSKIPLPNQSQTIKVPIGSKSGTTLPLLVVIMVPLLLVIMILYVRARLKRRKRQKLARAAAAADEDGTGAATDIKAKKPAKVKKAKKASGTAKQKADSAPNSQSAA